MIDSNKNNTNTQGKPFNKKRHYFDKGNRGKKETASVTKLATQEDLLKLKDFFDKKSNH